MPNKNDYQKANVAAAFSISIVSFLTLIPIVNKISIPFAGGGAGIVSRAATMNISPYTPYVKLFTLLIVPSLLGIITLGVRQDITTSYWRTVTRVVGRLSILLSNAKFLNTLILILIFLWSVNKNYIPLNFTLTDAFHEGEYLGFLPNFLTLEKPFLKSFMIHGFGLDVWTSLIANSLSNPNYPNIIALTRFLRMTQGMIGYLGCFWIIWEIIQSVKTNFQKQNIFFLLSITFIIFDGVFFSFFTDKFAGRDTLFVLQLALTIRYLRIVKLDSLHKIEKIILPILIGISLPVSIFHVYDRAVYYLLIYLLTCSLLIAFGPGFFRDFLSKSIVGLAASLILIVIILGIDQVLEVLSQIIFWIQYGRYLSFNPLPPKNINLPLVIWMALVWIRFSFAILAQVSSIVYLVFEYRRSSGLGEFLKDQCSFIILLFASLIYMRIALDKPSHAEYVGCGSLISAFLLIYLGLNIYKTYFKAQISQLRLESLFKYLVLISVALIILSHPVLNPISLLAKLNILSTTYRTPDIEILQPDFLRTYNAIRSEVNQSSCFFTLNQQGLWYYLFNQPSCSKFGIIYYARTQDAQETVVHEIDSSKPKIILFGSTSYPNAFEGVLVSDAVPIIYRYFLYHYEPHVLVQSQWFWQLRQRKPNFVMHDDTPLFYGSVDTVLNQTTLKGDRVSLSGAATLPDQSKIVDAVYVSYGENNQLIEVTKVDQNSRWTVPIPTISLPLGKSVLRVWSYDGKSNQLVQIGKDIKINLIAQYAFQEAS